MTKLSPTLADDLIRQNLKPDFRVIDKSSWLARTLAGARRFVLDDSMSAFLSDLAYASLRTTNDYSKANQLMESLRTQARLPHAVTWIEYNMRAKANRAVAEYGAELTLGDLDLPDKCGWLCVQHPKMETAFLALEATSHTYNLKKERVAIPQAGWVAYQWRCDDGVPPWPKPDVELLSDNPLEMPGGYRRPAGWSSAMPIEAWLTGISTYRNPNVGVAAVPGINPEFVKHAVVKSGFDVIGELASDLRYLWALLATIDDLPVTVGDVRGSKGYVARGRYRKFVDHKVIHLTVPERRYRRVAAQLVAHARRRAHQVRGHWRKDWRHMPSVLCEHEWQTVSEVACCKNCGGHKMWIKEHQRGDASLGFVTHDYAVTHGTT